ncbi:hypothetical protein [Peterkaempfera bronchialis]|nr:hypothetical protein [Peterkaempfera bronchialis]
MRSSNDAASKTLAMPLRQAASAASLRDRPSGVSSQYTPRRSWSQL